MTSDKRFCTVIIVMGLAAIAVSIALDSALPAMGALGVAVVMFIAS